ncbi:DDE-type integrase/transposase/recombinase, partial [Streptococcus dysgalactiae subsp. equisimilis]|nr:DDE-type integrase/transposase/recombinase [Streptococcus dysgalactiae subsp. equisimilis]
DAMRITTSIAATLDGVEVKNTAKVNIAVRENPLLQVIERISSWYKLLKTIAWLTRFASYWRLMHTQRRKCSISVGKLTPEEIQQAETDILCLVQSNAFPEEFRFLADKNLTRRSRRRTALSRLNPVLINGLLRVGGRLSNAAIPLDMKHPIIIPKNHHVSKLIAWYYHQNEGHAGLSHVISRIRTRFWLVHGTSVVKRVISQCAVCLKLKASRGQQMMSSLPAVRVQPGWYPFSQVGLDYFGPIEVRRGRSDEKRYGCLFTCMQSRAVHIEVAHSMSTDSFMMLLTRFIGRRGAPTDLYSDNGSNFVGAKAELKVWWQSMDQEKISGSLLSKGIRWHFNPPYSSHRGGVWERLVRSVRRLMCTLMTEQPVSDETLSTVFVEIERILNNRPIVPMLRDDVDAVSLCPNDLLLLRGNDGVRLNDTIAERYRRRWKQLQYLASVFWKRWTHEYLPTLQRRQKWINEHRNFKEGDVVLVVSENVRKDSWPLGVVVKCQIDEDGLVRTVDLRTSRGIMTRDVRKVCLLEGAE